MRKVSWRHNAVHQRKFSFVFFSNSPFFSNFRFLPTKPTTNSYAAPEIFAHQEYGAAVDVWSIGVNMYAMLLGKLPFKVENRSRNLAKLHACILKGCEIPNTLTRGSSSNRQTFGLDSFVSLLFRLSRSSFEASRTFAIETNFHGRSSSSSVSHRKSRRHSTIPLSTLFWSQRNKQAHRQISGIQVGFLNRRSKSNSDFSLIEDTVIQKTKSKKPSFIESR